MSARALWLVLALPATAGLLLFLHEGKASADDPAPKPRLKIERVFPELSFDKPTHLTGSGDKSGRLFVCEQKGTIWVVEPGKNGEKATKSVYLDITDRTRTRDNEEGLLSVAFHPKFKENGKLFVAYSTGKKYWQSTYKGDRKDAVRTRVSRFQATSSAAASVEASTEKVVIDGDKPWGNHNGGQLAFGPDGFLYFGLGDGGAGGDPEGNGQDLSRLLGKIHRLDVDKAEPYAIPPTNPFVKVEGARPEIWCYGVRNPWRFSFDRKTGKLWVGDVGQDKYECIRKVERGSNHGWSIWEAAHPYKRPGKPQTARDPVTMPVHEYDRKDGACVIGGFVYRGDRLRSLQGIYFFADYATGHFFGLRETGKEPDVWRVVEKSKKAPSSFGEGDDAELYFVSHEAETGGIYRFQLGD
ncbi:PQQ-dependent sugar dehydrogenase [bacterium]|nr:PQQ-dependent sugar dehydrogenase [bacterium]